MHKDARKTKWDDSVRMFGKRDLIAGGDPTEHGKTGSFAEL
jgi:hypothetical protein